ncbi:hypothetical protein BGW80DRAFT_1323949, partial [Lactifluus volemus]
LEDMVIRAKLRTRNRAFEQLFILVSLDLSPLTFTRFYEISAYNPIVNVGTAMQSQQGLVLFLLCYVTQVLYRF